jgi:hypothetical protein
MRNIKLFKEFALYVDKDGKMRESDWETDENEDIGPGDLVHFKKYGTLYVVTLTSDGYVVSEDEGQRYMGDNGDGFIIPLSAALDSQILEKGDDDAYLTESKIKDVNSLIVGKRYKITWPNYDDYEEGLDPETDIVEVISKNRIDGYVLKNIEHDFTFSKQPSMLGDCDIELLESVSNEVEVKFVSKRNRTQAFNVYKTPDGRITRIEKPNHVHVNFPFKVGQILNRNIETWACNNHFYINGKDTCPEEKVFGIRKSDIPQGHELRNLFPNKFR